MREHFLLNMLSTECDGKDNIGNIPPLAYVLSKTQYREKCAMWINDKLDLKCLKRSPEFMDCKYSWGTQRNRQA